ncbi:helix-turn-helix domain-containing protein [Pseudonocardia hispaniensis]|uniref:Helix-turn-helix domain-containing protein n=1 Tax=Pseudonocardia hispaniensis TaxID=904933 RepID=A0ABW1IX11_9PSEU
MLTYTGNEVRRWLAGVGAIAAAVNASTPLPELLDLIARTACELTGYEAAAVLLADETGRSLVISGSEGLSAEYVAQVNERHTIELGSGPLADGPSSRAFRIAQPVPIADILADPSFEPWARVAQENGYRAIGSVPLLVAGEPVGTLNCYCRTVHEFGPDELALLCTLANQAGTALQSARLITSLTEQRRLLEHAEEIHRELTAVALRAGGVQGVAEALARLLARPVLVTDRDGLAAANVTHRGVQLAPESTADLELPDDRIAEVPGASRVTVPVLLGQEVVARLWLPGRLVELSELERRATEHAAVVCALEYLRRRTAVDVEWRLRADLLTELLSGTVPASVASRAVPLGHDLTRTHTVLVASPDGSVDTASGRALLGIAQTVAERCEPRPLVTSSGEHVIVLWPETPHGPEASATADVIRTMARRALDQRTVTVVVGHRCAEVEAFRSAVRTARGALELARLHGGDRTVTLPDLGVYGLLLQLNDPRELVRFAEQTLAPLREYDERKGGVLIETLRTYLAQDMNVARTAGEMYVHPNTVGLRLRRVEELMGVSMRRPETLLRLKVALMAQDVLGLARLDDAHP